MRNTMLAAESTTPVPAGATLRGRALLVSEHAAAGTDLNGDGDVWDVVVHVLRLR